MQWSVKNAQIKVGIAEQVGNHKASKLFHVDRKRVREWCKTKETLQACRGCKHAPCPNLIKTVVQMTRRQTTTALVINCLVHT